MSKSIYITTAIDYANGTPHIGHAIEKVQADVLARFYKMQDRDVYFVTGTDEHGQKIFEKAESQNRNVKEMVDEYAGIFQKMDEVLNVKFDDFIRTTDQKKHWPSVQKMWEKLVEAGDLKLDKYEGLYCVGCEEYKQEKDLVDGKCPLHDKSPEKVEEENYFFNIGKYTDEIIKRIENNEFVIIPETRRNEVINILKEKQEFVSFSRPKEKLSWGIPVPNNPEHVMYVWCDALTNYISALDYANEGEKYKKYWKNGEITQFIGKDIARFHTLIWPAMLLAAGVKLPDRIFIHGFISMNGKKLSKTTGNIIDPFELVEKFGTDPVRYYLLKEIPAFGDGDYSEERFREVYQSDLANGIGNLFSRVTNMVDQYLDGAVDMSDYHSRKSGNLEMNKYTENLQYDKALDILMHKVSNVNKLIDDEKPWQLAKSEDRGDREKLEKVLIEAVNDLYSIAKALTPFLPTTGKTIIDHLAQDKITKAEPLFPRL